MVQAIKETSCVGLYSERCSQTAFVDSAEIRVNLYAHTRILIRTYAYIYTHIRVNLYAYYVRFLVKVYLSGTVRVKTFCLEIKIFTVAFLIAFVGTPPIAAPRISLKNSSSFLLDQILIVLVPFD